MFPGENLFRKYKGQFFVMAIDIHEVQKDLSR